jgi:hypothetical protein
MTRDLFLCFSTRSSSVGEKRIEYELEFEEATVFGTSVRLERSLID